jgi:wyosine [tRNA(Phe)-imidazoG37] synthetase (radical SAM superfamily)
MEKGINHIYGPVLSRRLGISLGVDLIPYKTCTYDCIYCQLGRTTCLTRKRATYTPVDDVLSALEQNLQNIAGPDYITLAGSGEPTLHDGISDIILGIRSMTSTPIAILTNGSLLHDRRVQVDCSLADVVLPSVDAGDELTFSRVNRPMPELTFQSLIDGLIDFRRVFSGQIWLEVLLLHAITDNDAAVRRIARRASEIRPDRIHLNTVVRPASDVSVRAVPLSALQRFTGFFTPEAEIAFNFDSSPDGHDLPIEAIFRTVQRRPSTLGEIAGLMNVSPVEVTKIIEELIRYGRLRVVRHGGETYFTVSPEESLVEGRRGNTNVTGSQGS